MGFAGFRGEPEFGEPLHGFFGIVDFPAKVVHSFATLLDEFSDRMCVIKGLNEL